ncbi:hypothetical protein H0H87_008794 [Tephrocybe sp. NHM501043]|nr:hypothetical protein H0H87_008794 [Tephrocybe sp. NHM501043]
MGYIFESLSPTPVSFTIALITASHVCTRWRHIVIGTPSLWTILAIHTTRLPEVFADIVSRSENYCFKLNINLPSLDPGLLSDQGKLEFRATFKTLKRHVERLQTLHVEANNWTFFLIFNRYLYEASFPKLVELYLRQVDPTARRYTLGPVTFNPEVFTKIHLESIMIDCDASCLAGLRTVKLINSSGTFLNQRQLHHSTYPTIPQAPVMANIAKLFIGFTSLAPTIDGFLPSFYPPSLHALALAWISSSSAAAAEANRCLFHHTYSQNLRYLRCHSIDAVSFEIFLSPMKSLPPHSPPRYPFLQRLVLVQVDLKAVNAHVLRSFPQVRSLTLVDLDPDPLLTLLLDTELMPVLHFITVFPAGGHSTMIPRPRPAPVVPPSEALHCTTPL